MEVFISHASALQYWRLHGKTKGDKRQLISRRRPPTNQQDVFAVHNGHICGLSLPIDTIVSTKEARRWSQVVRPHVFSAVIPDYSLLSIGNGILVSSPEFCFFQLADKLPLIKLIELGFELCGTYSLPEMGSQGEHSVTIKEGKYGVAPLTSTKKLSTFVTHMAGVRGRNKALRALKYITDGSASPMETKLTMLLTLPYMLGGYGFPMPKLNSRVEPAGSAKRATNKSYYSCDLFWADLNLAVEYDSDTYHTGSERIDSDSRRRNTLLSVGVTVIAVTSKQIYSLADFEKAARLIAINMGRRLQYKNPGFTTAQLELRRTLL